MLASGAGGSLDIPTLGTKHSQPGNIVFPPWEYLTRYKKTTKLRVIPNKGRLLKKNLPVSENKEALSR